MTAPLITLSGASLQGVPRSEAWTSRAIGLLEQQALDDQVEVEQLQCDLEHERELRAERQRIADAAFAEYLELRRQKYGPRPSVFERFGQKFRIADEPPAQLAPLVVGEERRGSGPLADAYWTWKEAEEQVATGAGDDRRMVRMQDGTEQLLETLQVERLAYLQHQVGVRQSRLAALHSHLERLAAPEAPPVEVVSIDEQGREQRATLSARLALSVLGRRF